MGEGQAITTENPDGSQTAKIVNPASPAAEMDILPPESGFVFRSDEALQWHDLSRIRSEQMRRRIAKHIAAKFGDRVSVRDGYVAYVGEPGRRIATLYDRAIENPDKYGVEVLMPVEGRTRRMIEEARPDWDLDGYYHAVNTNDLRHTYNRHVGGNEESAQLIPMDREDIKRMGLAMSRPDSVMPDPQRPGTIILKRSLPGGRLCLVEVERAGKRQRGRKTLMQKTMWKEKPDDAQLAD